MATNNCTRVKAPDFSSLTSPSTQSESYDGVFLNSCVLSQEQKVSEFGRVGDPVNDSGNSIMMSVLQDEKEKRSSRIISQQTPFKLKECRVVCKRLEDVEFSVVEDDSGSSQVTGSHSLSSSPFEEFCQHCALIFDSAEDLRLHIPECREKLWVNDVSLHAPSDLDFLGAPCDPTSQEHSLVDLCSGDVSDFNCVFSDEALPLFPRNERGSSSCDKGLHEEPTIVTSTNDLESMSLKFSKETAAKESCWEEVQKRNRTTIKDTVYGGGMLRYREYKRGLGGQIRKSAAPEVGTNQVDIGAKLLSDTGRTVDNHKVTSDISTNRENGYSNLLKMCKDFEIHIDDSMCHPVKAGDGSGRIVQGAICESCKKIFTNSRQLKVHLRQHVECSSFTFQCQTCHLSFEKQAGLDQHQRRYCRSQSLSGKVTNSAQGMSSDSSPLARIDKDSNHVDTNHSVKSRYVLEEEACQLNKIPVLMPIKWPLMREDKKWKMFEDAVMCQLDGNSSAEDRLNRLQNVIYSEGKDRFGCVERRPSSPKEPNRRERKLASVRKEIKNLTKLARNCDNDEERGGLLLVRSELIDKKRQLRRAENSRKRRWRRRKAQKRFWNDPYKASKEILSDKVHVPLNVEKEVIDDYVRNVASDPLRDVDLGVLEGLPEAARPTVDFDNSRFSFAEFNQVVRRRRTASKPGPNKIPYKVYKKCIKIRGFLYGIIVSMIKSKKVPLNWRVSDGVFIPKVDKPTSTDINDYRQIALMNVEGKIFWALVGNRLYKYLVEDNSYIKSNAQKGSIREMAGCWEHTSMVWTALKDARSRRKTLTVLWLDLANAYGSVPHKLIEYALRRYHVPEEWVELVLAYYDGLWGRSSSSGVTSDWARYERGIFAGCTVSVILFLIAFNLILEFVDRGDLDRYQLNEYYIEALRAFMDDLSILVPNVPAAHLALERTNIALEWARMKVKPSKSRSLFIKKGIVQKVEPFTVNGEIIPGLHKEPLRTLGRIFNCSINDCKACEDFCQKFEESLKKIDKSPLMGVMKAWALVHILQLQIKWDYMIYDIPLSTVEWMERGQNVYLRKWFGFAKHLSDVALYCDKVPCPLPLKSLVALFKETKVSSFMQLKYSKDDQVLGCATQRKDPRGKWKTAEALDLAESRRNVSRVVGDVRGVSLGSKNELPPRAGLGYIPFNNENVIDGSKKHREQVIQSMRAEQNEAYHAKAVTLSVQGAWTRWSNFVKRDLSWRHILFTKSNLLKFCIGSTYDTLSTPNNLHRWGIVDDPRCALCNQEGCSMLHILSACNTAFGQGRYTWRHNCILRVLADGIQSFMNTNKVVSQGIKRVHFVVEGKGKEKKSRKPNFGFLHKSNDFKLHMDLDKRLKYPSHIADTEERPDIVLYSDKLKLVLHIELTSPGEERFQASYKKKMLSYGPGSALHEKCQENGWKSLCFPVEVGVRGYTSTTLGTCLRKLGLGKQKVRKVIRDAGDTALRCSFWLWVLRNQIEWKYSTGFRHMSENVNNHSLFSGPTKPENSAKSGDTPAKDNSKIERKTKRSRKPKQRKLPQQKRRVTLKKSSNTVNIPSSDTRVVMGPSRDTRIVVQSSQSTGSVIPERPNGIENIGNSCYINAVLQCVFNVTKTSLRENFGSVNAPLQHLYGNWLIPSAKVLDPRAFKASFTSKCKEFNNMISQDADEFLAALIKFLGKSKYAKELKKIIGGSFASVLTCRECLHRSIKKDPFLSVDLELLEVERATLGSLVKHFEKPEVLEDKSLCSKCRKMCLFQKSLKIDVTSSWLVILLKRFKYDNDKFSKLSCKIDFVDENFTLAGKTFNLCCVLCHRGSRTSGHYYSYVLMHGKWFLCDDPRVVAVPRFHVLQEIVNNYMLFYKAQE